jgi:hypothetical protein
MLGFLLALHLDLLGVHFNIPKHATTLLHVFAGVHFDRADVGDSLGDSKLGHDELVPIHIERAALYFYFPTVFRFV